jgi:hypothetical protein
VRVGYAKANSEVASKVRFSARIVAEAKTAWVPSQVTPQKSSQHPSRDDEPFPVTLEEEIGGLLSFVAGQEALQDVPASVGGPYVYAPHADFVSFQRRHGRWWPPGLGVGSCAPHSFHVSRRWGSSRSPS